MAAFRAIVLELVLLLGLFGVFVIEAGDAEASEAAKYIAFDVCGMVYDRALVDLQTISNLCIQQYQALHPAPPTSTGPAPPVPMPKLDHPERCESTESPRISHEYFRDYLQKLCNNAKAPPYFPDTKAGTPAPTVSQDSTTGRWVLTASGVAGPSWQTKALQQACQVVSADLAVRISPKVINDLLVWISMIPPAPNDKTAEQDSRWYWHSRRKIDPIINKVRNKYCLNHFYVPSTTPPKPAEPTALQPPKPAAQPPAPKP